MSCWRWAALGSLAGLLVFGGCGGGSSLTTTNATPVPQSAIPSNITAGSDGFTVFLTGTGFVSSSKGVTFAYWNGAPRSTTFNLTTNQLAVQIPASDVVAAGVGDITLVNPPPGGGPSQNGLDFTIVAAQAGGRTISSFSPASANAGDKAFTLTVNGDNFTVNDVVTWNGSVRPTTFMSSAQVSAQINASDVAASGLASVAVNAPGLLIASPSVNFPIGGPNNASPSISSLSPSSTAGGRGGSANSREGFGIRCKLGGRIGQHAAGYFLLERFATCRGDSCRGYCREGYVAGGGDNPGAGRRSLQNSDVYSQLIGRLLVTLTCLDPFWM